MRLSRRQYKYAVRRLKRCNDRIQNKKLISGLINNRRNIFEEVRKFRGNNTVISSRIDEEVGAGNIAELFAAKYKGRYNNVLNGYKLDYIRQEVTENVDKEHECILGKVNENLISQAIKKLQANKRDALFDTISDCYINGPSNLKTHIKNLVRIFIIHGSVPNFILACILTPLVKDGLGDITNSDNYRAIAGGCLLLKVIDLVIIALEGDKLSYDCMQFAYQSKSSTTM